MCIYFWHLAKHISWLVCSAVGVLHKGAICAISHVNNHKHYSPTHIPPHTYMQSSVHTPLTADLYCVLYLPAPPLCPLHQDSAVRDVQVQSLGLLFWLVCVFWVYTLSSCFFCSYSGHLGVNGYFLVLVVGYFVVICNYLYTNTWLYCMCT